MLENMVECSGNGTRQITGRHRAEDSAINSAEEFVCTCTCKVRSDGRDAISILVIISLLPFIYFYIGLVILQMYCYSTST